MRQMRPAMRPATLSLTLLLAGLLVLAGCGSKKGQYTTALATVRGLVPGWGTAAAPAPDVRAQLTRALLDRVTAPTLLVELPARGSVATLALAGANDGVLSWLTGDGIGISQRAGVLSATRGLGRDLMSADLQEPLAQIRGGASAATAVRVHRYFDTENRTFARSFICSYSRPGTEVIEIVEKRFRTRRIDETCRTSGYSFENSYWLGEDGTMWKSRQWVSPEVGYAVFERLVK